jgi:hypothetical protein
LAPDNCGINKNATAAISVITIAKLSFFIGDD